MQSEKESIMKCPNCGKEMRDGYLFCSKDEMCIRDRCYEMMYKEPVQESDVRRLVLDTVSKFHHNIRASR